MKKLLLASLAIFLFTIPSVSLSASNWGTLYRYSYYSDQNKTQFVGLETYNSCTNQRTLHGSVTPYVKVQRISMECGGGGPL